MNRYQNAERLKKEAEEPVVVRTLHQLKEAILPFLPKSQESTTTITTTTKGMISDNKERIPTNGSISAEVSVPNMNRLLVQGLEIAENQAEIIASIDLEDDMFGGFQPAMLPKEELNYIWVDTLIKYRLNGKRRGSTVSWELDEGTFIFNPRTGELLREV